MNTVKLRTDLHGIAHPPDGFAGCSVLIYAAFHQRVTLVAKVRLKLLFDDGPSLFPAELPANKLGIFFETFRLWQAKHLPA